MGQMYQAVSSSAALVPLSNRGGNERMRARSALALRRRLTMPRSTSADLKGAVVPVHPIPAGGGCHAIDEGPCSLGSTSTTTAQRGIGPAARSTQSGLAEDGIAGPSAMEPGRFLEAGADVVCLGEGDDTIVDLVRWASGARRLRDVTGAAFRSEWTKHDSTRVPVRSAKTWTRSIRSDPASGEGRATSGCRAFGPSRAGDGALASRQDGRASALTPRVARR